MYRLKIAAIGVLFLLGGCENGYKEELFPVIPLELSDCKFYKVQNTNGTSIRVVRCPNSESISATYQSGKTQMHTVTINGKQYRELETDESNNRRQPINH